MGTVINTYGGRWFDEIWKAQLDSPESSAAIKFYIDTIKNTGEPGTTQAGFTECETLMVQARSACGTTQRRPALPDARPRRADALRYGPAESGADLLAGLVEGFITPRGLGLGPVIVIGASLGAVYWALVLWRGRPARDDPYLDVAEPPSGTPHAATAVPAPSP